MNINPVNGGLPVQKVVNQPVQKQVPADAPTQIPLTDKLELSGMSHWLSALKSNDIRADKVSEIKSQIDGGTYESDDKMNVAIDRLLDDLNR